METPYGLQAGKPFSVNFSGFFPEENAGTITAGSLIFPQVHSFFPESFVHRNSFLLDLVPSISEGNISNFAFSAVIPSSEASNIFTISADNSS